MRTRRAIYGFILTIAVFVVGAAVYEARRFRALEMSQQELRRQLADLRTSNAAAQKFGALLTKRLQDQGAARGSAARSELAQGAEIRAKSLADVAKRKARIQKRMDLELNLRPEFEILGLSPVQWEKYASLMIERGESLADARGAAHAQGLAGADYRAAVHNVVDAVDTEIRGVVGDQAFQRLQDFNDALQLRQEVQSFANNLLGTDISLSTDQETQLEKLLANNRSALPSVEEGAFFVPNAIVTQAQGILSAPQFAAWSRQEAVRQLLHQTNEIFSGPAAPAAVSTSPSGH